MASPIDPFVTEPRIAYFSMEIAIRPEMHTYSGGLGVLAGDSARSAADLGLPMVFLTLANRAGYFRQTIDAGRQKEAPDTWDPAAWCEPLDAMIAVEIEQRQVWIRPWLYVHTGKDGHRIPILLLDTDLEHNDEVDRKLTGQLYGGDGAYRLKQEILLGIGGVRILRAIGMEIRTYHMNEGHAALLTLELLSRWKNNAHATVTAETPYENAEVRRLCVFTTHTPVAAGHDRFPYDLYESVAPDVVDLEAVKALAGSDELNMTRLAMNLSAYVNAVAERHAETSEKMFPGYRIHAITNGVHVGTWAHDAFAELFDANWPRWQQEPEILVRAISLKEDDIWQAHLAAKSDLIARTKALTGVSFDLKAPIIAYARRMTGYKRPFLLFSDIKRLTALAREQPFQIVMAGKAHPRDDSGKQAIRQIHDLAKTLQGQIKIAFLPGYNMDVAKTLVSGADVWLNTPTPPLEASGTSGMKAGLNGVLNLSVLDGWWVEACVDGANGWAIGTDGGPSSDKDHAAALYDKLEKTVLPTYHGDPQKWRWMMKQSIGTVASYFNSQRMMRRYAAEAYLR